MVIFLMLDKLEIVRGYLFYEIYLEQSNTSVVVFLGYFL